MALRKEIAWPLVAASLLVACSGSSSSGAASNDAGTSEDASGADGSDGAIADAAADKSSACASTFGSAIGSVGFARFDGTVVAVLAPGNNCGDAGNRTHLVLEIRTSGDVYRMVVDVNDSSSPGTIRATTLSHDLVGGAWSDGWHAVPLDYPSMLGVHSTDFKVLSTADAVAEITDALNIGARVSVFATAQGEVDSAHLIHRNNPNQDGAIVVNVDGAPKWLLFSFASYTF